MYMTHYEPWRLLKQFHQDLDQLFTQPNEQESGDSTIATSAWVPRVDLKEETNQFVLEADIPGVDPKDIEITMENGVLTIKGERHITNKEEKNSYKRVERLHGVFHRRFSLPETADPERITASGKHGVLQIVIPKRQVAQARKISVQS
jgi:HSP20 family protein